MGASLITLVYTVDTAKFDKASIDAVHDYLTPEVLERLWNVSAPVLKDAVEMLMDESEESKEAIFDQIVDILLEGLHTALNQPRYHNWYELSDEQALVISGGATWGDDPYDGYTAECALVDAALSDPGLAELTGIVGSVPSAVEYAH